jgi:hypothetical protein
MSELHEYRRQEDFDGYTLVGYQIAFEFMKGETTYYDRKYSQALYVPQVKCVFAEDVHYDEVVSNSDVFEPDTRFVSVPYAHILFIWNRGFSVYNALKVAGDANAYHTQNV